MTKQQISTNPFATSDALFRAWGLAHSNALASANPSRLTQTADTGQINWTTVTKPAAQTKAGYEIWKMTDTGLPDIYIKIEYGIGAPVAASTCTIWVTIGTGTNGAGTLTGATQALDVPVAMSSASNANTNANSASYIAAPAGSLVMVVNYGTITGGLAGACAAVLVLDRTRDAAGSPSGVGAVALWCRALTTSFIYFSMYGFNISNPGVVAAKPPISAVPDATAMSPASALVLARHYGAIPAVVAIVGALTYLNAEALALTEFDVTPMGSTSRHYLTLGSAAAGGAATNQSNAGGANAAATNEQAACIAVLWED